MNPPPLRVRGDSPCETMLRASSFPQWRGCSPNQRNHYYSLLQQSTCSFEANATAAFRELSTPASRRQCETCPPMPMASDHLEDGRGQASSDTKSYPNWGLAGSKYLVRHLPVHVCEILKGVTNAWESSRPCNASGSCRGWNSDSILDGACHGKKDPKTARDL